MEPCAFDILFAKNVPHILEKIFFSLDYKSFKKCPEVSKSWNNLIKSERFQPLFREEVEKDLWQASRIGNFYGVERILKNFMVNVNCVDARLSNTPLYKASSTGNKDLVQLLLDNGAEHNQTDEYKDTPLTLARRRGQTGVVDILERLM